MSHYSILTVLATILCFTSLSAQVDYNKVYRELNPTNADMTAAERKRVLNEYIQAADSKADTIRSVHGRMYLSLEYLLQSDYVEAMRYLSDAEQALGSGDYKLLRGRIAHKKAYLYTMLEDYERAIALFDNSLAYSSQSGDSQYIAITYEQLGAVWGYRGQTEKAEHYYRTALPLIRRHADSSSLLVTYANYGNLLREQGHPKQAIAQYRLALQIGTQLKRSFMSVPSMNNLAGEYIRLDSFALARSWLTKSLELSRINGWEDFMAESYRRYHQLYEAMGIMDSALYYNELYHQISDSLTGAEVQVQIAVAEAERKLAQEKRNTARAEEAASRQRRNRQLYLFLFLGLLVIGVALLYRLKRNITLTEKELAHQRKQLLALTRNTRDSPREANYDATSPGAIADSRPYEAKILTDEDWEKFKRHFERKFPAYMHRLRDKFGTLTEAEERLFLLLKLKLSRNEIASILGIQSESVKKTRTRLRKRLNLNSHQDLQQFIDKF